MKNTVIFPNLPLLLCLVVDAVLLATITETGIQPQELNCCKTLLNPIRNAFLRRYYCSISRAAGMDPLTSDPNWAVPSAFESSSDGDLVLYQCSLDFNNIYIGPLTWGTSSITVVSLLPSPAEVRRITHRLYHRSFVYHSECPTDGAGRRSSSDSVNSSEPRP
ncbi:hypothetical protein BT96DRAFT_992381 [Gymnopus androsaceus JB14]|uniref:Uncharacterized protein n=1 Tax=Gymnopus androsaceus JB14 TaxID=1447944 RepID=A0A6A4HW74_9AGAR|nr:hypothetical protein BT96DRAFT_992381 [Gymnopus androsaceus JB14]